MRLFQNFMIFILLTAIGILYKRYEAKYFPDEELDKYSLVRKYLLNESESMAGKKILWIHTKHDINSRNWSTFGSRNSRKLNQPYKDLCVESIIRQCGNSFNVCLINDESIGKLLPERTIQLCQLADPIKHKFMGCKKGSESMKELIENLEVIISESHNDLVKFEGTIDKHINKLCMEGKCGLVCGKALGVKDKENKVILVNQLLNNSPLNLCMCSLSCIILPDDEILKRHKYNWFVRLSHRQVLGGEFQASKFMILSLGK